MALRTRLAFQKDRADVACLGYGGYRLDGSPRMRERPIGQLVDGLRALALAIDPAADLPDIGSPPPFPAP